MTKSARNQSARSVLKQANLANSLKQDLPAQVVAGAKVGSGADCTGSLDKVDQSKHSHQMDDEASKQRLGSDERSTSSKVVEQRSGGSDVSAGGAPSGQLASERGAAKRADQLRRLRAEPDTDGAAGAKTAALGAEEDTDEPVAPGGELEGDYAPQLVWRNIVLFVILHSFLAVGVRMLWLGQVRAYTLLWSLAGIYISSIGVTGGAHRLWSHKAYKARWPMQVLLMALQTMAGQNSVYTWCRDHRVHHKFSETHADPHNIKRGFFFAHMGWLCCRKHPEVKRRGASIDMSDLEANPVVMFQHRNFWWLTALFNVLLPTMVPVWFWRERFWVSFTFAFLLRYLISLHGTWLVNSAAHYWGSRPYDQRMEARESPVSILTGLGEGFHNYHHTFPFDYAASEFGHYFNLTTAFIDLCAKLGLAFDRRSMSSALIEQRQARTGDPAPASRLGIAKASPLSQQATSGGAGGAVGSASRARSSELRLVSDLIQELPYISGFFSMNYSV